MSVFRGFPAQGVVACYDETPGGGDIEDFDAPRNAPAKFPEQYLDRVIWHSALSQYEVALGPISVPVTHTAFAGSTQTFSIIGDATVQLNVFGAQRTSDINLGAHGASGVPKIMLALSGRIIPEGFLVQNDGSTGVSRFVAPWADSTNTYIRELAVSSNSTLPAISLTYQLLVLRKRSADPLLPLFSGSSSSLQLGRGMIESSRSYLRKTGVGDSPFSLDNDIGIDAENGYVRSASGGVISTESGYTGSMPAPPFIQVGL